MFLSDGVHDNLDPQILGKKPRDFGLEGAEWTDIDVDSGTQVKTVRLPPPLPPVFIRMCWHPLRALSSFLKTHFFFARVFTFELFLHPQARFISVVVSAHEVNLEIHDRSSHGSYSEKWKSHVSQKYCFSINALLP